MYIYKHSKVNYREFFCNQAIQLISHSVTFNYAYHIK